MSDNDASKEIQIKPLAETEAGYVVLPYSPEQFKEFVKSLLGSPQTVSRKLDGVFEIDKNEVINLHSLLEQRISQQNGGVLAQFNARIAFSDNSTIDFNSIDNFLTYNELKPLVTNALHITWDYLIRFQDKKSPERQRINVSFVASSKEPITLDDSSVLSSNQTRYIVSRRGYVSLRIEHTARTWGTDIDSLLANHIQSLFKTDSSGRKWIREHSTKLSLGVALLVLTLGSLLIYNATARMNRYYTNDINALIKPLEHSSIESINQKLDYIITSRIPLSNSGPAWIIAIIVIITIGMAVGFGFASLDFFDDAQPSFILLTKQSLKDRDATLEGNRRTWFRFIVATVVAIIVNIVSNILFIWLYN